MPRLYHDTSIFYLHCLCHQTAPHIWLWSHSWGSKQVNNKALYTLLLACLTMSLVTDKGSFFTGSCGDFELQKKVMWIRASARYRMWQQQGQVLTQGQWPALMTIDNNLSLFDFQPNSLLERGNHCLKTASNKWSGSLYKTSKINLKRYQWTVYLYNACGALSPAFSPLNFALIIHACEIAWLEVTL